MCPGVYHIRPSRGQVLMRTQPHCTHSQIMTGRSYLAPVISAYSLCTFAVQVMAVLMPLLALFMLTMSLAKQKCMLLLESSRAGKRFNYYY